MHMLLLRGKKYTDYHPYHLNQSIIVQNIFLYPTIINHYVFFHFTTLFVTNGYKLYLLLQQIQLTVYLLPTALY